MTDPSEFRRDRRDDESESRLSPSSDVLGEYARRYSDDSAGAVFSSSMALSAAFARALRPLLPPVRPRLGGAYDSRRGYVPPLEPVSDASRAELLKAAMGAAAGFLPFLLKTS